MPLSHLSDALYRTTLDALAEAVVVFSPEGKVVTCNKAAERMQGTNLAHMREKGLADWRLVKEDGSPWPTEALPVARTLARGESVRDALVGYVPPDQKIIWTLVNCEPVLDRETGGVIAAVLSITDITARKKAEDEQKKLNRALSAFSASDWALVHATDEQAYMEAVCRLIVQDCGYLMAWVGFAEDTEDKPVRPVAHYGLDDGYLAAARISWADNERGRGPTGRAIRSNRPAICNHMLTDPAFAPWRENALQRGFAASLGLPLAADGRVFGALTLYSRLPEPFVPDEVNILNEVAAGLAYGIGMLRLRSTHTRHEESLRSSEERYRLLVEQMVDGIFVADSRGRYLDVTPAGAAMLGYAREEILALSIPDVIQPEEAARIGQEVARFNGGMAATSEWRFRRKDGSTFIGEVVGRQLADGRLQAVLRDVTARRQAEQELQEARLAALNLAQDALEAQGQMEAANNRLQKEIQERQAMMLELERARATAAAASEAKSAFLANMSHEIRTPLNAVLGLAQVGQRDNAGRQSQDTFNRILQSGQLLLSLINDILDFSKIEAGKMTLEQESFDLGDVLDSAVDVNSARAYAKGLSFQVWESPRLPTRCIGDPLRLVQILVNLLSNAIKFTESGLVRLAAEAEDSSLLFTIRDTGIGMTEEQASRLFTPFEQADGSTTRRYGGTGLGLAISKRLVDLMGGHIRVDSTPGEGSLFELRLPLVADAPPRKAPDGARIVMLGLDAGQCEDVQVPLSELGASMVCLERDEAYQAGPNDLLVVPEGDLADPTRRAELTIMDSAGVRLAVVHVPGEVPDTRLPPGALRLDQPLRARHLFSALEAEIPPAESVMPGARLAGYRILAAEDNEVNRLVLDQLLSGEGAHLECVENGQEAVDRVSAEGAQHWDIVLMDVQMPIMDGHEATRLLRQLAPTLPVVGLTAHAMAEEKARCAASGMVAHISKPVALDELVSVIHREARTPPPGAVPARPEAPGPAPALPRAPRAQPGIGLIDWAALQRQYATNPAFVVKLAAMALKRQLETPAKLRSAAGKPEELAFLAHALKGVAGNLHARDLMEQAAQCELAAKEDLATVPVLTEQLARGVEALAAELQSYLDACDSETS